ncbi:pp-loop family protein [Grosmannia clavigera kw1407]|uniref:tRNA(Ile)-lysidine synthetase n=1 Tax=Grosmannia clavigera (strain kw1407 / UAMH 11150) TaxID=655863 RepID=F0XV48_GROCL|nr:pp-loop family protein [Grosmannia clavigera kw1407]EFW98472.1 pp-loop family protein [Grosmannia clavigera kw1407]
MFVSFVLSSSFVAHSSALAISGGVDSMALAFLCSQLRRVDPWFRIADAPVGGFTALIVDHRLRDGSAVEAQAVAEAVRNLGHRTQVWALTNFGGSSSSSSSSIETAARHFRYRCLGVRMAQSRLVSLLLAHHADDQYETVLLRLLTGYGLHGGIRGLRGMRPAVDIPECRGLYGAHQSGLGEDRRHPQPYLMHAPSRRERRRIKSAMREDMAGEGSRRLGVLGLEGVDLDLDLDLDLELDPDDHYLQNYNPPHILPLDTEDLGIVAYRPLLAFPKARLIATCEAHNVPWFEDPTNADPGLTLRNAVRHIARHHRLPAALQPPSVLRLAERCHATAVAQEAEASRLLVRARVVVRFSTNAGTALVRLPRLVAFPRRRPVIGPAASAVYAAASRTRRHAHLRTIAALIVQRLLALVSPEPNPSPISQLQTVVDVLFPALADRSQSRSAHPKPFTICGVHFVPAVSTSSAATQPWVLARAPYPATPSAQPSIRFPALALPRRWDMSAAVAWPWPAWGRWHLYDGRFWIRLRSRLPVSVELRPFAADHAKPLRDSLGSPAAQAALQAALKTHAPGKARYTLPALYATGDVSWALAGREYWPVDTDGDEAKTSSSLRHPETEGSHLDTHRWRRFTWERQQHQDDRRLRLVALPTIGVHVPRIEHWLQWETRYRKVDTELLERAGVEPWAWP